ncbi:MAG: hypothetical protein Udaeo2_30390 [Candidatus Udaeobacter sp.]|nr:MAG: hypothetical protein Udaeo2_30390 [Candidatus Udaeobacter sp.]
MVRGMQHSLGINQTNILNDQFESTYALLGRSEEKGGEVLEILVYAVFISVSSYRSGNLRRLLL